MTQSADPLQNLRAIQMPAQPHWWPPAPGWWIVLAIILLGLSLYGFRVWRKKRWQQKILQEVDNVILQHPENRPLQLSGLSEILRRVALRAFPREQVAPLHGQKWLEFLDQHDQQRGTFLQASARALADETYQPPHQTQPLTSNDPLVKTVRNWIRRNLS